jgi:GrpB-like predicted nucleotidyltransferase (UPF0157 family)
MEPDNIDAPPAWAFEDVRVVDSDPRWARDGMHFAAEVRGLLGDWLCSPVVHVGSTAVPGLAAKPIIDLQATVSDPAAIIASNGDAMVAASWFFVPRELDQRPWRWFVVRADRSGRHRLAHLHLMQPGEPRWYQQIAFRDLLRADPALAQQYARLKTQAASTHAGDREAYTKAKDSFVADSLARTRHHEPDPENPWVDGRPALRQNPRRL